MVCMASNVHIKPKSWSSTSSTSSVSSVKVGKRRQSLAEQDVRKSRQKHHILLHKKTPAFANKSSPRKTYENISCDSKRTEFEQNNDENNSAWLHVKSASQELTNSQRSLADRIKDIVLTSTDKVQDVSTNLSLCSVPHGLPQDESEEAMDCDEELRNEVFSSQSSNITDSEKIYQKKLRSAMAKSYNVSNSMISKPNSQPMTAQTTSQATSTSTVILKKRGGFRKRTNHVRPRFTEEKSKKLPDDEDSGFSKYSSAEQKLVRVKESSQLSEKDTVTFRSQTNISASKQKTYSRSQQVSIPSKSTAVSTHTKPKVEKQVENFAKNQQTNIGQSRLSSTDTNKGQGHLTSSDTHQFQGHQPLIEVRQCRIGESLAISLVQVNSNVSIHQRVTILYLIIQLYVAN